MLSCKRAFYPTAAAIASSQRTHKRYKTTVTRVFSPSASEWSGCSNPAFNNDATSELIANRYSCAPQLNPSGVCQSSGFEISNNQERGCSDHDDEDDTSSSSLAKSPLPCGVTLTQDGQVVFAEDKAKVKTEQPIMRRKGKTLRPRQVKQPRLRATRRRGELSFNNKTQRWVPNVRSQRASSVRWPSLTADSVRSSSAVLSVDEIDERIMMLMRRIEQNKPWRFAYRCLRVPFALDKDKDRMDFLFEHWDAFWRRHGHAIWERNYWAPLEVGSTEYNKRGWRQKAAKRAFYDLSVYLNAKLGSRFWNQLRREMCDGWWYRSRPFPLRRLFQKDRRGFDEYMSRSKHRRRWPRGRKVAKRIDPTWCLGWHEGDETTDYEHINSESMGALSDTDSSSTDSSSETSDQTESNESSESDESLQANESLANETDEESPDTRDLFEEANEKRETLAIDSSDDGELGDDEDGELGDDELSDDDSEMDSSSDTDGDQCDQVQQRCVMMVL